MKRIENVQIKRNEVGLILLSVFDNEIEKWVSDGLTKQEALCVAYYILGLTDSMEE